MTLQQTNSTTNDIETQPPTGTHVFQCANCSQILADSFSWVCSHKQLNSFTTSVITKGVVISDELETSRQGVDLGSTTVGLSCGGCNTVLGKIYKTTPRWLDGIRDLYTFNQDKIKSYQLGTEEPPATMSGKNLFTASADDILSRMGKLELLCVSLFERVGELEKTLKGKNDDARGRVRTRVSQGSPELQ